MRRKRLHIEMSRSITRQSFDIHSYTHSLTGLCSLLQRLIASYLEAKDLARLVTVCRALSFDAEVLVRSNLESFYQAAKISDKSDFLSVQPKLRNQSWTEYLHLQTNLVYRVFVYYTGYKTWAMRTANPHWAFGFVDVDPNDPAKTILPNEWKFHTHEPWSRCRLNGKDGEWTLRYSYQHTRAPKSFHRKVATWARSLQVGSFLTAAYQNADSEECGWWQAQVWYVWKVGRRAEPVKVYGFDHPQYSNIHPDALLEHFSANPLHTIDAGSTPGKRCTSCTARKHSFIDCHVKFGHPML